MKNLQSKIKELRKQNGMTQEELAAKLRENYDLKTDRVMVSKWETGFQTPEIYTILCMAEIFGVSIDYLNGQKSLKIPKLIYSQNITEEDIKATLFGSYEVVTDEMWQEVKTFVEYIKDREMRRKQEVTVESSRSSRPRSMVAYGGKGNKSTRKKKKTTI